MMTLNSAAFWLLVFVTAAILASMIGRSRNQSSPIDLEDLLLGADGKLSKAAALLFAAFFFSSWVVGLQTLRGTLSDATFAAYLAAWVAPTLAAMFKRKEPPEKDH